MKFGPAGTSYPCPPWRGVYLRESSFELQKNKGISAGLGPASHVRLRESSITEKTKTKTKTSENRPGWDQLKSALERCPL